jgi:hypothetical protein
LNVAHAQRDGVVIASSRDAPIHGKPNPDVPNHDTRRASPMDTGRSKGSRTQDNRRTPSEDNNRRMVVVVGRRGQNSVAGLHTGAVRPGQPQPREWRPTESPSAARLTTSRRALRASNGASIRRMFNYRAIALTLTACTIVQIVDEVMSSFRATAAD